MQLTRKTVAIKSVGAAAVSSASRLSRAALSGLQAGTIDRRTFLRRSGMVAGGGVFASQLPFNLIGEAGAESAAKAGAEGGKT
jgi:formate dehydrogenase major subunit